MAGEEQQDDDTMPELKESIGGEVCLGFMQPNLTSG